MQHQAQQQAFFRQKQLQGMLQLSNSPAKDWESQYWKRRVAEVLEEKDNGYPRFTFDYNDRHHFYRFINSKVVRLAPIDYLEFGVAGGTSFQNWMQLNKSPQSRFYGFDSFEGLPEDWYSAAPKGSYTQGGMTPKTGDPRGTFIKGLFQETLPDFVASFEPQNRLVMHLDADLYSSTLYVLTMMDRFIVPGTIILFDEFMARKGADEFAALHDYSRSYYKNWKMLAAREDHNKLAIEIIPR